MLSLKSIQRIALCIFFFSINFEVYDPTGQGFLSVSKITGLFYFATIIPESNLFFKVKYIEKYLKILWIFFSYLCFISFLNINSEDYSYFDFSIFQNIILFWLLVNHERKEAGILQTGFLFFAIGSVCLAILFKLGIGVEYSSDARVSLFGDNENTVGIRMAVSILIFLTLIIQKTTHIGKLRYVFICFIPIMLLLMANTGSRGSFLSLGLSFIIATLLIKTKKVISKIAILLIALFLGIFLWNFIMQIDVLKYRLQLAEAGDLAGRQDIWYHILPLIKDHPFFGVGTTGYSYFANRVFGHVSSPHNVILEILAYSGIFGLILYLVLWLLLIKEAFRNYVKKGSILPFILFIPMAILLISGQILYTKLGWVIFAFAASRIFYNKVCHDNRYGV